MPPVTVGEVCAGYGGLGMGLSLLCPARTLWVADVPDLSHGARMRLLGNGVVPQQAAYAINSLSNSYKTEVGE